MCTLNKHLLFFNFLVPRDCGTNSYPVDELALLLAPPSWGFGVNGGTGEPPDSSDGVFDKNKLPPSSDTSVMGELYAFNYYNAQPKNKKS